MGNYSECVIGVCDKDMRYLELHKDINVDGHPSNTLVF